MGDVGKGEEREMRIQVRARATVPRAQPSSVTIRSGQPGSQNLSLSTRSLSTIRSYTSHFMHESECKNRVSQATNFTTPPAALILALQ